MLSRLSEQSLVPSDDRPVTEYRQQTLAPDVGANDHAWYGDGTGVTRRQGRSEGCCDLSIESTGRLGEREVVDQLGRCSEAVDDDLVRIEAHDTTATTETRPVQSPEPENNFPSPEEIRGIESTYRYAQ